MHQTSAAVPIELLEIFMVFAHLHCPSGASLHYAVCYTTCCSYSLRMGSYLCPSCHFVHFVLRSANYTTFIAMSLLQGMAHPSSPQIKTQVMHIPFRKSTLQYSLGSIPLHYVLYSLQSHSVHPLPIFFCLPTFKYQQLYHQRG